MKINIALLIFIILLISWQVWELTKYGDDARINIFTTGDYLKIIPS